MERRCSSSFLITIPLSSCSFSPPVVSAVIDMPPAINQLSSQAECRLLSERAGFASLEGAAQEGEFIHLNWRVHYHLLLLLICHPDLLSGSPVESNKLMQIKSPMYKLFDLLRFSPIFQTHQLIGCPDSKSNQLSPSQLTLLNLLLSCGIVLHSPDMAAALETTDLPQPKMIDLILRDGARYGEQPSNRCRGHRFSHCLHLLCQVFSFAQLFPSFFCIFCLPENDEGRPVLYTPPLILLAARLKVVVYSVPAFPKAGWFPVEPQLARQHVCSDWNWFAFTVSSK